MKGKRMSKVKIKLIGNQLVYYRKKSDKIIEFFGTINEKEAELSKTAMQNWSISEEESSLLLEKLERIGKAIKDYGREESQE